MTTADFSKNFFRRMILILASVYLLVTLFGLQMSFATNHSAMPNCATVVHDTGSLFCPMGVVEHITHWQKTFATTFQQIVSLGVFLLVAFWFLGQRSLFNTFRFRKNFYYRARSRLRPLYLWLELFSSGILNPKLF